MADDGNNDGSMELMNYGRIVKVIRIIKRRRNRAGYQSIQSFLNRDEPKLDMETLKRCLKEMEDVKLIEKKINDEKESFSVLEESVQSIDMPKKKHGDDIDEEKNIDDFSDLDDSYQKLSYNALVKKIKIEVKNQVKSELSMLNTNELTVVNPVTTENHDATVINALKDEIASFKNQLSAKNDNDLLVNALRNQIEFLQKEVESQKEVIKILANDRQTFFKSMKDITNKNTADTCDENLSSNSNNDENKINDKNIQANSIDNKFNVVKPKKSNKRNITILSDSTAKSIEAYRMQRDMSSKDKVYLKCFPGAVTEDFYDYAKPSKKFSNQMYVCHFGTNSLRSPKPPESLAKDIVNVALDLKTENNEVAVSSITHRADRLNAKALKVNEFLKSLCDTHSLGFIDNSNITKYHVNGSGIHLTEQGTVELAVNFLRHINA